MTDLEECRRMLLPYVESTDWEFILYYSKYHCFKRGDLVLTWWCGSWYLDTTVGHNANWMKVTSMQAAVVLQTDEAEALAFYRTLNPCWLPAH